jgi:CheY-like chemotaxis protein
MNMIEDDKFALVPRTPGAIEKAEAGTKHVLTGMVTDALALVRKELRPKPKIVWVDDDSEFLQMMESIFGNEFTILKFQNGEKAWQELQRQDPDILITDMERPNDSMDGWVMIPLLAEKKVKFPVIVVSGCFELPEENWAEIYETELYKYFPEDSAKFHNLLQNARQTLNIASFVKVYLLDPEEMMRLKLKLKLSLNG